MRSQTPKDFDGLPTVIQEAYRNSFLKPKFTWLGREVADPDKAMQVWLGMQSSQINRDGLMGDILFHLGADPGRTYVKEVAYRSKHGDVKHWEIFFERGEKDRFFQVDFYINPNETDFNTFTETARRELMGDITQDVLSPKDFDPEQYNQDSIQYFPRTGMSIGSRTDIGTIEDGLIADSVSRIRMMKVDDNGEVCESGIVRKANKSKEISERERTILEGIVKNDNLRQLGVTAPEVYEQWEDAIFTKDIPQVTVEEHLQKPYVRPEEKCRLIERIVKATEVIEREIIPRPSEEEVGSVIEQASYLGERHGEIARIMQDKNMFDRMLSDSRLSNWLYDPEKDLLYKIDENAPMVGSRYSCLVRAVDFSNSASMDEKERLIEMLRDKDHDEKDAYLSLYLTAVLTAGRLEKKFKATNKINYFRNMQNRINTAREYLSRIDDKALEKEFESRFKY